jgi:EmrB/QacA subfamily drug resistance transporter
VSADGLSAAADDNPPVRRVLVFSIISLALLMMSVDSTIVATALHALQRGLDTSINWAGWTITAYSFGFVLMLPVTGRLCELFGRRRVFLGSVLAFTVTSLCCAVAEDIYVLIALRALQAAAGAGFTPSATGLVVDHFGPTRDRAVSLFGSIFPIGAMIGPIFGGLFVTYWSWRGIFFVNVPLGAAVLVLSLRYLPRDPPRRAGERARMDTAGMALLGLGLIAGMLAATSVGERGTRVWAPQFVAPALVAAIAATMFFRHINRSADPFIEPRLIHGPGFGPINLVNACFGGIPAAAITLLPLYAANRYGIDALSSGTLLVAQGFATVLLSLAGALVLRRTGHRPPIYVGSVVMAIGLVLLAVHPGGVSPYAWLAFGAFVLGAGFGAINPASRNAGLQLAPQQSATIAALRTMGMQVGSITAISIATALLASSADPGLVQVWFDVISAVVLVAALPLIARVPEHHGSW